MEVFITALCMYGICFSIQYAKLFSKPRLWLRSRSEFIDDLLSCSFCSGAWSGLLTYLLLHLPLGIFVWYTAISYFFAGAAWCYICDVITTWLEIAKD